MHWFNLPKFFAECKRMLKDSGVVCLSTYDFGSIGSADADIHLQEVRLLAVESIMMKWRLAISCTTRRWRRSGTRIGSSLMTTTSRFILPSVMWNGTPVLRRSLSVLRVLMRGLVQHEGGDEQRNDLAWVLCVHLHVVRLVKGGSGSR